MAGAGDLESTGISQAIERKEDGGVNQPQHRARVEEDVGIFAGIENT
jgi:hypothetical protein